MGLIEFNDADILKAKPNTISRRTRIGTFLFNYTLGISVVGFILMLILRAMLANSPSTDLAGIESNVVYSIQQLMYSGNLYADPQYLPYSITQYTPLYYYVCSFTAKVFQINSVTAIDQIYLIGRGWNICFNLLTGLAIFLICSEVLKLNKWAAILAATSSFVFLFRPNFSVRPDSLHDTVVMFAIYSFLVYLSKLKTRKDFIPLLLAAFLSVTSVFVKQSGLQVPIIMFVFLLFIADWKGFIVYTLSGIVVFTGLMFLFVELYDKAFILNVIGGVSNGISFDWFSTYILSTSFYLKILLPATAVVFICLYKLFIFKANPVERFLGFCAGGTFVFALVTSMRMGSSIQYFTVFQNVALILLIYYCLGKQTTFRPTLSTVFKQSDYKIIISCYLAFMLVLNLYAQFRKITTDINNTALIESENKVALQVAEYVKYKLADEKGKYVFANLAAEDRKGINNALMQNAILPQLEILDVSTAKLDVLGYKNIEKQLSNGTIKYMIETDPAFDFSVLSNLDELRNNYQLVKQIGPYFIYEYDGKQ